MSKVIFWLNAETKMKTVGNWTNEGKCEQVNETCADGMGRQMQTRTCESGNIDICTDLDRQQSIACNPDCPSKGETFIKNGTYNVLR